MNQRYTTKRRRKDSPAGQRIEKRSEFFQTAYDRITEMYEERISMHGAISVESLWRSIEHMADGPGRSTGDCFRGRVNAIDFITDVEHAIDAALESGELAAYHDMDVPVSERTAQKIGRSFVVRKLYPAGGYFSSSRMKTSGSANHGD